MHDGLVSAIGGEKVAYWDLVSGEALNREATGLVKPKPAHRHRYIGHSVNRVDLTPKMLGQAMFVQEQRPAGMLFGHIVRPPTYQAKLLSVNLAAAQNQAQQTHRHQNASACGWRARGENHPGHLPAPVPHARLHQHIGGHRHLGCRGAWSSHCAVALEVEVNRRNGRIRVLRAVRRQMWATSSTPMA